MEKIHDLIIIGGGPAGYTAALYGARAGLDTLVIEKMTIGGQMTETGDIDNYPGFNEGIDGISLGMKMQAGAEKFGAVTIYDEVRAVSLSGEVKKISTAYSGELCARAVIIATGAGPRRLGLDGEEKLVGQGIHYCAHCDGRFYKDKTVAVVSKKVSKVRFTVLTVIFTLFVIGSSIPWESLIKTTVFSDFNTTLSKIVMGEYSLFSNIIVSNGTLFSVFAKYLSSMYVFDKFHKYVAYSVAFVSLLL